MWFCFDMIKKYKLTSTLLMITGYVTETKDDHFNTLNTIKRLYSENYTSAVKFSFCNVLMTHPNDSIHKKYKDEILFPGEVDTGYNWVYKENTLYRRYENLKEIKNLIYSLYNIPEDPVDDVSNALAKLRELEQYLDISTKNNSSKTSINKYYFFTEDTNVFKRNKPKKIKIDKPLVIRL